MFSDDEPELRDLIVQNLEKCGFLNKIKAELRAGVFLALEEEGNLKDKIPLLNKTLDEYVRTPEGKIIISLVREFLEYFNLNFTLSVFDPEVASSTAFISRSELHDKFKLLTGENEGPVISTLLKDIVGKQTHNFDGKSNKESIRKPEDLSSISYPNATVTGLISLENIPSSRKIVTQEEKKYVQESSDMDYLTKISEEETKVNLGKDNTQEEVLKDITTVTKTSTPKETYSTAKKENQINIFSESKDLYSLDHDFFDDPVPPEKTSLFGFSDSFKNKNESKLGTNTDKNSADAKRSSLSSLRDLPSISNNSWITNKDSKDSPQSLAALKSFSTTSDTISESDSKGKGVLDKKDSDVIESNEESSEKQNSEESIEEDIEEEEDFSAGMDDLLNSSLSLAEDATTDQTVSQVSVVDGVDHVEPCNS